MTLDQIILFSLFFLVFVGLLWGKWRYDLVAFTALVVGLIAGVVPTDIAFEGFGHPATIIVALVLIVSRGLTNSGAVDLITRSVIDHSRSIGMHITMLGGIGGILSAFMNNVAALALLMPVDIQAAQKAGRAPGQTLMPLSFATILGGLITLIGTPPNIIIGSFRETALGEPFGMFDFAPVGLIVAVIGIAFVATVGWRLIPEQKQSKNSPKDLMELEGYVADLVVAEGSSAIGQQVKELDAVAEENDCIILGLSRRGKRLPGRARNEEIREGDSLIIEAAPASINALVGALGLQYQGQATSSKNALSGDLVLAEAVVGNDSRLIDRTAMNIRLLSRYGVSLLGLSRQGKTQREQVRKTKLQAGDIILLLGPPDAVEDVIPRMGCLPLADRGLQVTQYERAGLAIGLFAAALIAASIGWLYLPVALALVAVVFVYTDIVPIRELYDTIEWPVVVLLGSMIPLGSALESSGGTQLIVNGLAAATADLPAWVALTLLMIVTMTLSDVLNNTATAIVAAPIAVGLASQMGVNPDTFLMAVAIAASCAFLTPIGHKNNMLVLGPGGYSFSDYWRMGLPLEIIIVAVSVPALLVFWPL
ncbi:SLC13 family permease [Maritalea mediterranea]|uniref:SLC13 family permease n=1 Tax=Maritalea mediterranea TaxID=2909667 RepID=A0ABS9E9D9_9HYPH|nr:SLC13 family permease [Maritalea mediterranea]MCF4099488.1 SLC13 family permease [Maritalea mediterranea]